VDREGEGDHEECRNPTRPSLALEGEDGDGYEQGDAREAIRQPERDLLSDIGDRAGAAIGGDAEGAHDDPGGDAEGVADHGRAGRQHHRRGEQGCDQVEGTEYPHLGLACHGLDDLAEDHADPHAGTDGAEAAP
jgi:hypothetical protein